MARDMRRQTLFLLLILMLAAALRFYDLTYQSLWGDEAHSIYNAKGVDLHFMSAPLVDATHSMFVNPHPGALDTILACIRNEGTPPLYFLALAGWIVALGSSDLAVRSLSAIFGVLGVAAFFLLGRSIFRDSRRALLGALFVAASPLNIYFSQEARAYMLANLLATSCSWLLLCAVSRRARVAPWVAYGLAALAICYTHYFAALVLGAHLLYLLVHERQSLRPWLLTMWGVGLLFLPWYLAGLSTQMAVWTGYFAATRSSAGILLSGTAAGLRYILDSLVLGPMYSRAMIGPATKLSIEAMWLALVAIGAIRLLRAGDKKPVTFSLLLTLVPLAVITSFGLKNGTLWYMNPRYHIWESSGLFLLAAASITSFRRAAVRAVLACAICLTSLAAAPYHFYPMVFHSAYVKPDFRGAAKVITNSQEPRDVIVVNIPGHMIPLNIYYRGGLRQVGMGESETYKLRERLDYYTRDRDRVWLLVGLGTLGYGDEKITAFLDRRYPQKSVWDLPGLRLTLYSRGGPGAGTGTRRGETANVSYQGHTWAEGQRGSGSRASEPQQCCTEAA